MMVSGKCIIADIIASVHSSADKRSSVTGATAHPE